VCAAIGVLALAGARLVAQPGTGVPAAADATEGAVRAAIVSAVQDRIGSAAEVTLGNLSVQAAPVDGLVAIPEPGARVGHRVRFTLQAPSPDQAWHAFRSVGTASVDLQVSATHVEAAHVVRRGTILQKEDLQISRSVIDDVPLAALPAEQDLTGARAVRDLRAGEILTSAVVVIPPLVRSGESVVVHVKFPGGEVTGRATASQNGARGELIRLVNPTSGHALQGRVIGRDEVEVVR
jgi:flagella basal body P-ring formation protein FlgA